jgi:methylsterol monooxygenase
LSGTTVLVVAVYWIFGGIYTILDVTNKPAVLRRYKIQPGTNEPVDTKRLLQASTFLKLLWSLKSINLVQV